MINMHFILYGCIVSQVKEIGKTRRDNRLHSLVIPHALVSPVHRGKPLIFPN